MSVGDANMWKDLRNQHKQAYGFILDLNGTHVSKKSYFKLNCQHYGAVLQYFDKTLKKNT